MPNKQKETNMQTAVLRGTIVPLVTPFAADESFDAKAMARLIDYVLDQGADALMPTAVTGEGLQLTTDETIDVWDAVFRNAGGRVPIIPAVISTTTRESINLVRTAEEGGAAGVMVSPILSEPYAGQSNEEIYAFYADIAAATSLSIILFNYPSLTGIDFVPSLVVRLVEIDNVQYIKESTGDIRRVHGIQRLVGERLSVICGAPDVALESLALGCQAWITGIMNDVPRSAQQLVRSVNELGDLPLARRIYYNQILPLVDMLARNYNSIGTIKAGVCVRGVDVGYPRSPGRRVGPAECKLLERLIAKIARAEVETAAEMARR